jgi:hypothetical protein
VAEYLSSKDFGLQNTVRSIQVGFLTLGDT